MEMQMLNSIRYSTILTIIEISDHVEIGKLIGRKGRNLKPIEKGTEDIEIRNRRKDVEKEGNFVRIADNGTNHKHATPKNHKDNNQKEKRKRSKRKIPIRPKHDNDGSSNQLKTLEDIREKAKDNPYLKAELDNEGYPYSTSGFTNSRRV
ncbi:21972_t:CDS:2, partial [Rhizophagus irregularis]